MIYIYFLLLVFSSSIPEAEARRPLVEEFIKMISGQEFNGYLEMPVSNSSPRITFKDGKDGKKSAIRSDSIDYLILKTEDNLKHHIKRTLIYSTKYKLYQDKVWLLRTINCSNMEVFLGVISFSELDGKLVAYYIEGIGDQLIQRAQDKFPYPIGTKIIKKTLSPGWYDKRRLEAYKKYFRNESYIMKKLENFDKLPEVDADEILNSLCEN